MFTCILIVLWKRLSFRMKKKKQAFFIANLYKPSNCHIKKKNTKHSWLIRSQTRNRIRKNWLESNRLGKSITNVFLCVYFWVLHLYRKNWIPEAYSSACCCWSRNIHETDGNKQKYKNFSFLFCAKQENKIATLWNFSVSNVLSLPSQVEWYFSCSKFAS